MKKPTATSEDCKQHDVTYPSGSRIVLSGVDKPAKVLSEDCDKLKPI